MRIPPIAPWHLRAGLPALVLVLTALPAPAQRPAAAPARPPAFKGIWEPVPFPADVELTDVFFATPEVGWAVGGNATSNGVIIGTRDAGRTWTVQLGDPESSEWSYTQLRFVDGRTGFAAQGAPSGDDLLLRTTDGETWSVVGKVPEHRGDYVFVSPTVGVLSKGTTMVRTEDAGATWKQVFDCQVRVQVNGLTRNAACHLDAMHFPTRRVGYALGKSYDAPGLIVARTEDAGRTWTAWMGFPGEQGGESRVFFTDESRGTVCLVDGKLLATTDAGRTWTLVPGPGCTGKGAVRFADPEVAWTMRYQQFNYTTDGGRRWVGRTMQFPAMVNAFSLPRRDRGYVVGAHGMVYRYRVVPAAEPVPEGVLVAPAMPGISTDLDERVGGLGEAIAALERAVEGAPSAPAAADGATPAAPAPDAADAPVPFEADAAPLPSADLPQASPFVASCCGKAQGRLQLLLGGIVAALPQLLEKYRNTNSLGGALMMAVELPGKVGGLRRALAAFWRAPDKAAAQQALLDLSAATTALRSTTAMALQQEPAVAFVPEATPPGAADAAAAVDAAADSLGGTTRAATEQSASGVKKAVGGLLKKKIRIP